MVNTVYIFRETIEKATEGRNIVEMKPVEVIVIPDNATNGDIMKNTFPNVPVKIFEDMNTVIFGNAQFDLDWWNAPYDIVR